MQLKQPPVYCKLTDSHALVSVMNCCFIKRSYELGVNEHSGDTEADRDKLALHVRYNAKALVSELASSRSARSSSSMSVAWVISSRSGISWR